MIKIIIILGPTATGKSDLAVKLAKKFHGEVISADSRQVYKGLDIGTGKITKKEMEGVPHHILDVVNPRKNFSVVKFVELAHKAIDDIHNRENLPIVAGGTGFYIQALVDGIILPNVPRDIKLRKELSQKSPEELLDILKKLDPLRARNIDAKNSRRIIRAIEIADVLGKVPSLEKAQQKFDPLFIGLILKPEKMRTNIKKRLHERLMDSTGKNIQISMVEEAKRLHKNGLSWKRMNELGLEYRYLSLYLQNKITREDLEKILLSKIWQYSKRQMTWFKKDKRIKWYNQKDFKKIKDEVENFLKM